MRFLLHFPNDFASFSVFALSGAILYLNHVFLFRLVFNSHFVLSSFDIFIIQKTKAKSVKALMHRVNAASDDISSQIIPLCVFTFYLRHF